MHMQTSFATGLQKCQTIGGSESLSILNEDTLTKQPIPNISQKTKKDTPLHIWTVLHITPIEIFFNSTTCHPWSPIKLNTRWAFLGS